MKQVLRVIPPPPQNSQNKPQNKNNFKRKANILLLTQIKLGRYRNTNIIKYLTNKQINKKTKNIKANTCFHVILYIQSPVMGLFLYILLTTMITFPGTSLIIKRTS